MYELEALSYAYDVLNGLLLKLTLMVVAFGLAAGLPSAREKLVKSDWVYFLALFSWSSFSPEVYTLCGAWRSLARQYEPPLKNWSMSR